MACVAYTRFLLDIGHSQDLLALQVALAPCTLGYDAVAQMLFNHPDTKKGGEDNIYWAWIENYVAEDYVEAVRLASGEFGLGGPRKGLANCGTEQLEEEVGRQTPERVEELVKIFIQGTKVSVSPFPFLSWSPRRLTV
ncbi:hypothetical protein IMZ48_08460 [Candidatus Bathyarchaeota archaeon]|nr:hypothetical protein [Candidatus Bathyarchaeota archaeon]